VIFSTPVEVVDDPGQMRVRYEGFYGVPFARLRHGSQLDAVVEVATKVLLWAPLGAMFSLAVEGLCVPAAIRRMLLAALLVVAAGIGVSMEMAQVFLLPHVPDLTDVILYTAGTAAGMLFTLRVARPRQTPE
jgi:VanZ family protein